MAKKFTPAMLAGLSFKEKVLVKDERNGEEYEFEVRPLTHLEAEEVKGIASGGLQTEISQIGKKAKMRREEMKMDVAAVTRATAQAVRKAAILGLSDEWNPDQVIALPSAWIDEIGGRVMEISGLGNPNEDDEEEEEGAEDEESFREEASRGA